MKNTVQLYISSKTGSVDLRQKLENWSNQVTGTVLNVIAMPSCIQFKQSNRNPGFW